MATTRRFIKNSPNLIKKLYYKLIPFSKRYGKEFDFTYKFLLDSLEWDKNKMVDYQFTKLRNTIINAYESVPYYHKLFNDYGISPFIHDFNDVTKIPVLTKEIVRNNYNDLINKNYTGKRLNFKTSGSTGQKFHFEGDDNLYKREAAFVLRSFNLHNGSMYDVPSVWVRRYSPKEGEPLYNWDYELNRLYMSPFNISENTIEEYVRIINKTKSKTLVTYPSLANFMSLLMKEKNLYFDYVETIHCASEMVLPEWRQNVYDSLGIKIKAHYGMMEKVSFFSNTIESDMYLDNMEYGYTEIVDGNVIGTGFLNDVMPFIRYSTGDTAEKNDGDEYYKSLPYSVKDFIGRLTDMISTSDGRKLSGVNFYTMMYKIKGVEMFQIIQKDLKTIEVNIIVSEYYNDSTNLEICQGIFDRVGKCEIKINKVDEFRRSPNGKLKTIINECQS
jgi:phenylacetate-CoA ligase